MSQNTKGVGLDGLGQLFGGKPDNSIHAPATTSAPRSLAPKLPGQEAPDKSVMEQEMEKYCKELNDAKMQIDELDEEIRTISKQRDIEVADLNGRLGDAQARVESLENQDRERTSEVTRLLARIDDLQKELVAKDAPLQKLATDEQQVIADLEANENEKQRLATLAKDLAPLEQLQKDNRA